MSIVLTLKKKFRSWYYALNDNKVVIIQKPSILKGLKWITSKRYGRAYFKGYYETDIVSYFSQQIKQGDNFLDIGGHAGYFSFLVSRLSESGKIFTFEPDPDNSYFINRIIELNSIKNISLIAKGVGRQPGELLFEPGATSSTGKVSDSGTIRVPIVSIDDTLKNEIISGSLWMKIDVEGFGGEVIMGAMKTITKYYPSILMELHDNSNEREVLGSLSSLGYSFFNLQQQSESINNHHCRFYIAIKAQLKV